MPLEKVMMSWELPLVESVSGYMRESLKGEPEDYSEWTVLVPTQTAGRSLSVKLLEGVADHRGGLLPPQFRTPAGLLQEVGTDSRGASELGLTLAWREVLTNCDMERYRVIFGVESLDDRNGWAIRMGERIQRLRRRLVEGGWDIKGLAREQTLEIPERERWEKLSELEELYRRELEKRGLYDPEDLKRQAPSLGNYFRRYPKILLAGVPDPHRLLLDHLETAEQEGLEIHIAVCAPEKYRDRFDEWGRVREGHFVSDPIAEDELFPRLKILSDPKAQGELIQNLCQDYGNDAAALSVGSADPDVVRVLVEAGRGQERAFYDPEGESLARTETGRLLGIFHRWIESPSFNVLIDAVRHRVIRNWLESAYGLDPSLLDKSIDFALTEHLPVTRKSFCQQSDLSRFHSIVKTCNVLNSLLRKLSSPKKPFAESLFECLRAMYSKINIESPEEADTRQALGEVRELLSEWAIEGNIAGISSREALGIFMEFLSRRRIYREHGQDAKPVYGWLELAWDPRPHLVVAGMNDGMVPARDTEDPFLPDSLAGKLGLSDNTSRHRRDAYLLRWLLAGRQNQGRLDFLCGRWKMQAGDPLLPSQLFFAADSEDLAARVKRLLPGYSSEQSKPSAGFGWFLSPPHVELPESMSVTGFRDYLQCPFRFYLNRILRWEPWEGIPREMDARQAGTLIHSTFERFNRDEEAVQIMEQDLIREFLQETLTEFAGQQFGERPSAAVILQIDSLRERLREAATHIAVQRQSGWQPIKAEWSFHEDVELKFGHLEIRGKIDLLEQNRETGQYRIVDYKTADHSQNPMSAHLRNVRRQEPVIEEARYTDSHNKEWEWIDLQLPLYVLAVCRRFENTREVAYFNLPKAVGQTAISTWELDEVTLAGARDCAEAIASAIGSRQFWPPATNVPYDRWASWFPEDIHDRVDESWILRNGGGG